MPALADLADVIARQDFLAKHSPTCECGSRQAQIMDKTVPAKWRCRICARRFTYEPPTP